MINKKDVVSLCMPYPDATSRLALRRHMYVCMEQNGDEIILAKVQTDTPVARRSMNNYVAEYADINHNPFKHESLIDCDKLFRIKGCTIDDKMITRRRRDISDDLYNRIKETNPDKRIEDIDIGLLKQLNPSIE